MRLSNIMENIVLLEWNFTPADYFEYEMTLNYDGYKIEIKAGKIEAHIPHEIFDNELNLRNVLHKNLNNRFLGNQLLTNKIYQLSKSSMSKHYSDGRIDVTAFGELCSISLSPMTAEVIVKDKNGYIIRDSQKERIENKKEFARLAEKHCPNNSLVKSLCVFC